ncbi:hypothetical protein NFI96_023839 [Prochilodus magdalenae]|nr:hypothetical protein NFI96_023839 [Prochilodus magdalenae]
MYVDSKNPLELQISDVQPSDAGTYSCFPLKVQWTLSIEVTESKPELPRELLLYIIPSVAGAVAVSCIIICFKWIQSNHKEEERAVFIPASILRDLTLYMEKSENVSDSLTGVWNLTGGGISQISSERGSGHLSVWSAVKTNHQIV